PPARGRVNPADPHGSGIVIVRTVLANGVRVVTEAMPEVRSASIGFWIGAGSRDEPAELAGSSHFLEHLLFKGTDRHSALVIAEDVFGDHPLGRPVLGTVVTVSAASSESVREFHRAGYHPRNIVVSAAGSIEHDRLAEWITSLFPDDERLALRREPVAAAAG